MPSFLKIHNLNLGRRQSKFQHLFLKPAIPFPHPYGLRNKHSFLIQTNPRGLGKGQSRLKQCHQSLDPETSAEKPETIPQRCVLQNVLHSLHCRPPSTRNKSHRDWERAVQYWYWIVRAINLIALRTGDRLRPQR